ncbi:class E sortase [Streptomyces omiyaensis]|uniref:class E sortase n=1 Tax=Streptomyces omiyaensis TaxID=68247 RepID=UPI0016731FF5|nr:class E sortase [Streptomyces omiyaensis]
MRGRGRERVPVVVQARSGRRGLARALWIGAEAVVTCGVLVLLLVVHQLWWTNQQARAEAGERVEVLEREWDISPPAGTGTGAGAGAGGGVSSPSGGPVREPSAAPSSPAAAGGGSPRPARTSAAPVRPAAPPPSGETFAVLRIPRIGLTVPVARGISKSKVLDRGYVGHYPGTAAPGRAGNVALAGHRNTHGEPFRYVNRLRRGDEITLRTREGTYTYVVDQILPVTSPRDTGVIRPVPRSVVKPSYGYSAAGSYLTLTTCTPEFTSRHRLVVWAILRR